MNCPRLGKAWYAHYRVRLKVIQIGMKSSYYGFSLVELMVVLVIISLFTIIGFPSYAHYWIQIKRLEGKLTLLETTLLLEKYAATSGKGYLGATLEGLGVNQKTKRGWYQLSLENVESTDYALIAKPTFEDKFCTQLSCNAKGDYTYQGIGSYHDCWGK